MGGLIMNMLFISLLVSIFLYQLYMSLKGLGVRVPPWTFILTFVIVMVVFVSVS